jgi:hypothetical protein
MYSGDELGAQKRSRTLLGVCTGISESLDCWPDPRCMQVAAWCELEATARSHGERGKEYRCSQRVDDDGRNYGNG